MMKETLQMPKGKFLRVSCRKCRNEQVVFSKASTVVKCLKCDAELVSPTGGEAEVKGKILQALS
ncbi:MAG: 30S ribosomal protein S27e [Candidatus Aenigmarchaeota archaeon]|nr:30S ribosomal protein S27e [Candidatus Aenigmarchaeota archaeon]